MEWWARWWWCGLLLAAAQPPRYSSRIVHTHTGAIRGIIVEPMSRRLEPVEVFLGVPYAAQPPRLGPPPPPRAWPGTRLADTPPPACPQALPDVSNRSAALARMPLAAYNELVAAAPLLANQSEDCLYLNIYVPGSGARGVEAPYAVVVWVGGASLEWGGAAALDGAVLAARASLLVLTLNHRLGLLGFLTPGVRGEPAQAAGGAALLDVAAALHWLRRNIAAFGGDPRRVTLAGHRAGAALANALLMLPENKGLLSRVLLLSGSALGPAALAADAALAREHTAQALRCLPEPDHNQNWFIECIRSRPLAALVAVPAPRARFLAGWAPSPPAPPGPREGGEGPAARALHASDAFLEPALVVVVATAESYHFFNEEDIRQGFEEEHRNRILRTFVRNVYRYHRNEIFAAIRNEYTDWEKPIQHPINIRDATLESLSDGAGAAPAVRLAQLHAARGKPTYLAHFAHQSRPLDYPQRLGSIPSETLTYFLGLPLVGGRNYSRADLAVADAAVGLLASFAKTGSPAPRAGEPAWPRYELNTQHYLTIGSKLRVKSHYRGHKLALWLHLVPQLHRPGAGAPRHHQFRQHQPHMFAGEVFPELYPGSAAFEEEEEEEPAEEEEEEAGRGEECEGAPSPRPALPARPAAHPPREEELTLHEHYYSYTVALGVTVGAGCFLLALNVLVFAGLYLQRARRQTRARYGRCGARGDHSRAGGGGGVGSAGGGGGALASPRNTSLKRSCEAELKERPAGPAGAPPAGGGAPHKKRVQIQEISV